MIEFYNLNHSINTRPIVRFVHARTYRNSAQNNAHIKVDVYLRLLCSKILRVPRITLHPAQTTTFYLYLRNFIIVVLLGVSSQGAPYPKYSQQPSSHILISTLLSHVITKR